MIFRRKKVLTIRGTDCITNFDDQKIKNYSETIKFLKRKTYNVQGQAKPILFLELKVISLIYEQIITTTSVEKHHMGAIKELTSENPMFENNLRRGSSEVRVSSTQDSQRHFGSSLIHGREGLDDILPLSGLVLKVFVHFLEQPTFHTL